MYKLCIVTVQLFLYLLYSCMVMISIRRFSLANCEFEIIIGSFNNIHMFAIRRFTHNLRIVLSYIRFVGTIIRKSVFSFAWRTLISSLLFNLLRFHCMFLFKILIIFLWSTLIFSWLYLSSRHCLVLLFI